MRVLVCGGRDYGNLARLNHNRAHSEWPRLHREYRHVMDTLTRMSLRWPSTPEDEYGNSLPAVTVIAGGATGADSAAVDWAACNWCPFEEYPADWNAHGRSAGPIRNAEMLAKARPNVVIAFPGGKGTRDMKRQARAAGVKVVEVPDSAGEKS